MTSCCRASVVKPSDSDLTMTFDLSFILISTQDHIDQLREKTDTICAVTVHLCVKKEVGVDLWVTNTNMLLDAKSFVERITRERDKIEINRKNSKCSEDLVQLEY